MTQTQNRIFDEMAKMFTNAAGMAHGVRQEVETVMRAQMERLLAGLDLVQREEFEVVRDMAQKAREENEALKARLAVLEEALGKDMTVKPAAPRKPKAPKVPTAPEAPPVPQENMALADGTEPAESPRESSQESPKPDESSAS